jgi:hypothetical protein
MAEARAELSAQQMEASQSSSNVSNSEKEVVDNEEAQQPRMIADRAAFETRLQMPTGHEMVADLVNPS